MNNKYLIVGLIVIAAIGFYIWYQSKNQTGASQTLASAPSGGSTITGGASGGQDVPLNLAGQLLSGLTDSLKGFLGGKSSPATSTSANPVSNVIQTPPFSNPIAAPSDKSSNPVINPTVIPSPPVSTMPVDKTIGIPKSDLSSPIYPVASNQPVGAVTTHLKSLIGAPKIVSSAPPPSNTVSKPAVIPRVSGSGIAAFMQNQIIDQANRLNGNYEKSLFESL